MKPRYSIKRIYRRSRPTLSVMLVLAMIMSIFGMVPFGAYAQDPPTYTLTLEADPAGGGTVEDITDAGPYAEGALVEVKAEANAGYRFINWTDEEDEEVNTSEEFTYTMPAENVTLTANFVPVFDLDLVADPAGGGTVEDITDTGPYAEGAPVEVKAEANAG